MSFACPGHDLPQDPLEALWSDGKTDRNRAHAAVADDDSDAGAWVNADLHRKKRDRGNARCGLRAAKKSVADGALTSEWQVIRSALRPG